MTLGIKGKPNLKSRPLPKVSTAFGGWECQIDVIRYRIALLDNEIVKTRRKFQFYGVVQPMQAEKLNLKPEGERSWSWFTIHIRYPHTELINGDEIEIDNLNYKVMEKYDWSKSDYIEYHVIKNYE